MRENQASTTARFMAFFRAVESAKAPNRRLFCDPLAAVFLPVPWRAVVQLTRVHVLGTGILRLIDTRWPGARASGVARTRLIDDWVHGAVARGTEQIIILGAGYDARAYRLPELAGVRVFEVDHPATQAVKQTLMGLRLGLNSPPVTFVPLDFNRQSLASALVAAGVDATRPAFVIWEGVTNYLAAEAVDQTLRVVARLAPGNRLAFTYVDRAVLERPLDLRGGQRLARTLGRAGERWTFGLDPADVPDYVRARGLALEEDVDSVTYRRHYLGAGARNLRGYEFYHVARAQVQAGASGSVRAGAGHAAS
jgi:methyltransferase (TIGR00027 family)